MRDAPTSVIEDEIPEVAEIGDVSLREAVVDIWTEFLERSNWHDLRQLPVSVDIRRSQIDHARAVCFMALSAARAVAEFHGVPVDRDILISAALLQDVSKLLELDPVEYGEVYEATTSALGEAFPHAFMGARSAYDHDLPTAVCNIIATHSPQSGKFPQSIEGTILYYVDQLDVSVLAPGAWKKKIVVFR